jgi:hypothetical protein
MLDNRRSNRLCLAFDFGLWNEGRAEGTQQKTSVGGKFSKDNWSVVSDPKRHTFSEGVSCGKL